MKHLPSDYEMIDLVYFDGKPAIENFLVNIEDYVLIKNRFDFMKERIDSANINSIRTETLILYQERLRYYWDCHKDYIENSQKDYDLLVAIDRMLQKIEGELKLRSSPSHFYSVTSRHIGLA